MANLRQEGKRRSIPTIAHQQIGSVISHSKIVAEERIPPVSPRRAPLLHITRHSPKHAHQRYKHIPIQRIPNKPYIPFALLITIKTQNSKEESKREKRTNVLVTVEAEESEGIERREVAMRGLPAPAESVQGFGFPVGDAVPALENLFAGVIIPRGHQIWVSDPRTIRVVARASRR